ncbi:MAG: Cysteine desulfurase NifS [Verrucomicrobia subdivision 3 bacterium]|nr:Cysteine desulfurase NifS [Limisphaerales bacterium]MCS1413106.1 Cysteine desulfurase NifS [Limisphaerales bacterium]
MVYYFDYNATTPVAPEVFDAMVPYLRDRWGNPSSMYAFGHALKGVIESARESVAALIQADAGEVVFTSCGTESSNTALCCGLNAHPERRHLIMSGVEHSANLKTGAYLESLGFRVSYLPVQPDGLIELDQLEATIMTDTAMVSLMWANNETGVVFPIVEIGALCRERGVLFHTDAVQAAGKIPIDVRTASVDYLSLSGHKIYAPKGVGVLFVRDKAPYQSLILGGGQEKGRRAGTQNVASIVAMGEAARLAARNLDAEINRLRILRDRLEGGLLKLPFVCRNGDADARLPNTTNLGFSGIESEALLLLLEKEGVCASSGSACSTGLLEPSHVLTAMGVPRSLAMGSVRFSLGRMSTDAEVDHLVSVVPRLAERLRGVSPKM